MSHVVCGRTIVERALEPLFDGKPFEQAGKVYTDRQVRRWARKPGCSGRTLCSKDSRSAGSNETCVFMSSYAEECFRRAMLMGSTVNTLKQTTRVMRPDGSGNPSFPLWHTATAFYPRLRLLGQTVFSRSGACFGSGLSLTFRVREHCGVRFFLDYNLQPLHSTGSSEWMNTLTCGASVVVAFQ